MISDLRQVIAEQEKDLACINEEKRYYQMKLMSLQRNMEEEEDDYVDTEDFEVIEHDKRKDSSSSNVPNGCSQQQSSAQPQLNSLSIPPTIPECDDCDD